jgi:hypothetical protein
MHKFYSIITLITFLFCSCANRKMVAYYPFTGNPNDHGKHKLHGIVKGAELTTDRHGVANAAYLFDGNSYIEVNDHKLLQFDNNFCLTVWMNASTFKQMGSRLIDKSIGSKGTGFVLDTYSHDQLGRKIRLQCGEGWKYLSATALNSKEWYFIAVTYQDGVGKIYINGELNAEGASETIKKINVSTTPLRFGFDTGVRTGVDFDESFVGKLDDIRIYKRVLKASEIQRLYRE